MRIDPKKLPIGWSKEPEKETVTSAYLLVQKLAVEDYKKSILLEKQAK